MQSARCPVGIFVDTVYRENTTNVQMRLKQSDSWKALQIIDCSPMFLSLNFEEIMKELNI